MKFIAYISILAGLFVTINSCRKEQPAMKTLNEDCSCANEVSADFWMEERSGLVPEYYKYTDTDSIFAAKVVRFRAKEQNAEYTWYLGAETEQGVASVERNFPTSFIGQSLPVTLVVKKKPNHICFPHDDGYDSITKYISVAMLKADYYNRTDVPLNGSFRLKEENGSDSVDIEAGFFISQSGAVDRFVIRNIPNYNNSDSLYTYVDGTPTNYRQHWGQMSPYDINFYHRVDGSVTLVLDNLLEGQPTVTYHGRKL